MSLIVGRKLASGFVEHERSRAKAALKYQAQARGLGISRCQKDWVGLVRVTLPGIGAGTQENAASKRADSNWNS
jgi:hypothetical protein